MVDFEKIKALNVEIEKLLEERPEYRPLQEEIQRELAKAGDSKHNRCAIMVNIMLEKWMEILEVWK